MNSSCRPPGIDLVAARYAANWLTHNLSDASTPLGTGGKFVEA